MTEQHTTQNSTLATRTEAKYFALACGAAVWALICAFTGRAEAWDTNWYVYIGFPLKMLFAGMLGYYFPRKAYRHGLWIAGGEFIALILIGLIHGNGLGLLPIAIALGYILSIPLQLTAIISAFFGKRRKDFTPETQ